MWNECFLFAGLPEEAVRELAAALPPPFAFEKGQVLPLPPERGLVLLTNGRAQVTCRGADGTEHLLKYLAAGQVFGAAQLFEPAAQSSTVTALTAGQAQWIPEAALLALWRHCPEAAERYIRFLTGRVRFLNRRVFALSESSAQGKVWNYLLQRCEADGTVTLDRSMTALAATLGIGRASLYRCLEQLEAEGQLTRSGRRYQIRKDCIE